MILSLLLACTGAPTDDTGTAATITIVSPVDEATVCGTPLIVDTEVTNITLVEPFPEDSTEEAAPGTGHIDAALNGQEEDDWMFSGERITMNDIVDGYYQLKVELSGADHRPIEPYAGDVIYITVDATVCE